jgi:hypothetical protein
VGVELGVDVPDVGSHGVRRDEQLGGDLGRLEVARQVAQDAELGVAERVEQRCRVGVRRGSRAGEQVEDRRKEARVGAAVPRVALEELADRRDRRSIPSGSASSSARSIDASAPPRSPSWSRAAASSSDASTAAQEG